MIARSCAVLVVVVIACKGKEAPVTTAPAGSGSTASADDPKDWAVAMADLVSGGRMLLNFRETVPAGVTPAQRAQRVTMRCPYAARTDGFPEREVLRTLQSLELRLESQSAIRVMSKTGNGAREAVYQTDNGAAFVAGAKRVATELTLSCTTQIDDDPTWSMWDATLKQVAATPHE